MTLKDLCSADESKAKAGCHTVIDFSAADPSPFLQWQKESFSAADTFCLWIGRLMKLR